MTDISLVICTRNRSAQLAKTLRVVASMQPVASWDLIVVDNDSTDETQNVVAGFASVLPMRCVIEHARGNGAGRNTGWKLSDAQIVAFTDDDCYPAGDFIDAVLREFRARPDIGFVGGRVLLYDPKAARITIKESDVREEFEAKAFILSRGNSWGELRVPAARAGGRQRI